MQLSISVVVPTFKASSFIRETLASVFAQTRLPDEVIVVDDCSPDDTVEVLRQIATRSPIAFRVIPLKRNSGGPAHPLNVGIEAATGGLIATLDHDDQFPPNKIADQSAFFEDNPDLGLIFGEVQLLGNDEQRLRWMTSWLKTKMYIVPMTPVGENRFRMKSANVLEGLVYNTIHVGTCTNMLFPKSVWNKIGGFDRRIRTNVDLGFMVDAAAHFDFGFLSSLSACWNLHSNSFTVKSIDRPRIFDQLAVYEKLTQCSLAPAAAEELKKRIDELAFESAYRLRKLGDHTGALKCLRSALRSQPTSRKALKELGKVFVHAIAASLRRRPRIDPSDREATVSKNP